ncbi:MAG: TonB-dependent receptor [Acidobacteria bacterium]|nr:TonB-dependent receptor [Acidobacteriota bacterium]
MVRFLPLVLLLASVSLAQTGNGIVKGSVLDPAKAAVPGARAGLTNLDTNITTSGVSSGAGDYYFGNIVPGRYRLTVESPGFKRWTGTFVLEVGQTAVIDVPLEVGDVATTVTVEGVSAAITLGSSEIGDVKDALRIQQLPLNGRDITALFNLTPGVEGGGNPRVNGLKVGSVEMLLDGISLVDRFGGGITRVRPGLDTVEEFRIETTGSSARYSRPATVTLVTKSGANEFHGSAFETHRNNAAGLRARQRQDGNVPAKLIRNEFGASAGGPVLLPKLYNGKDKSFWFFAYEGLRQRTKNFQRDFVPTAALWDGNFSQMIDNAGFQTHIFDPLTTDARGVRTQFSGDVIPRSRFSPFFDTMRSITATPTNSLNPFQAENLEKFYSNVLDTNTFTVRGDHRFSSQDNLFGRFTRSRRYNSQDGGRFGSPAEGTRSFGTGLSDSKVYSASITYNRVFTPQFLNELLLVANRAPHRNGTLADDEPWASRLGLPNPFGVTGWPTLSATGPFGWDADNRSNQHLTAFEINDHATRILGKHSLSFGAKLRREDNNVRELQQAQGSHTFGGAWTAQYEPAGDQAVPRTGSGLPTMALGLPTFLSNQYNRGYFYFQQKEFGLYVHDNWKVSRRLTLDLGVRWDKWTPYHEKLNRLVNVEPTTIAARFEVITPDSVRMEQMQGVPPSVLASWARRGLTWKTAGETGFPSALLPADNNNFAPRIGAAFRITDRWVVRASYGEFFWTMPLSQILQTSRTNPPLNLRYTNPIGTLDSTATFAVRSVPRPEFFIGRASVDTEGIVLLPNTAQSIMMWDRRDWKDNRARSWHFTVEREVLRNTGLRLSYIGDHGRDLEQRFNINTVESEYNYQARTGQARPAVTDLRRVNPNWNFSASNHTGYSSAHSLQAEIERRYSNGLAFQWFYVFTRALTTTDAGGFTSGNGNINATDGQTAVPENINLIGAPNLSYDQRLRLMYYNNVNIPAHRVRYNAIWDLPVGRGKALGRNAGRALGALIGGWQLATIGDWRSGNWLSVGSGGYLFGDPTLSADQRLLLTFNGRPQRLWWRGDFDPTRASNVDSSKLLSLVPADRGQRIYRPAGAAFDNRIPQTLADGTARLTSITDMVNWNARGFFRGPGAWNIDASVFKNFQIAERVTARFTVDFFNAVNHPVDGGPNGTTGLQDLSVQANEPRIIQFSFRLSF